MEWFLRKAGMVCIFLIGVAFCRPLSGSEALSPSGVKVILDTDLDSDIDDMGALAMLLNMHQQGSIELTGEIVTSDDPYAPACADVMNTFYGLPEIPIGYLKGQPKLTNHSRYTRFIAQEFPGKIKNWQDAEDAVALYRKLLAQNENESVVIVTIGHLTSLQGLLQSTADSVSPLTGKELVKQKVNRWICMGGQFPEGKEANFYRPDPQSTVYCVTNWNKEVVFCGWEIGNKVITGGKGMKDNLNSSHPLYRGYQLYNDFAGRPSWDQIAVLLLTAESEKFFNYQTGTCIVNPDGSNSWKDDQNGKHKYVYFSPSADVNSVINYTENLMAGNNMDGKDAAGNPEKVNLIFDTDMLTDCDDAAAMAIMHQLADQGEVNILATMVSSRHPKSAVVVDVINTYYGRPGIPVGAPKNGAGAYRPNSSFLDKVASEFKHQLDSNDDAPDACHLYRKILASQPDHSVVILTVGYMSNIETLLKSGPDQFSEYSGLELVKKKVKSWVCMGGNFPVDPAKDNVNFTRDAHAAVYSINNWPGDLIFAGREIGHNIFIGDRLKSTPATNPVRRAYELHRTNAGKDHWNHHTADPCAVMLAIRGLGDYWTMEKDGTIDLKEDCSFEWKKKAGANQAYIVQKMDREKLGKIMEELVVMPPR
ncbi:MAG TPA: nucleoside hydrolase [Prolixibacteraceae bacterium]|nr:nucleoside hydrolase [Prolixibacteraceae bacterium]